MKPFDDANDDMLPEEGEAPYQKLIAALPRVFQKPVSISTPGEQDEAIARVRARLLLPDQANQADRRTGENTQNFQSQQAGVAASMPLAPLTRPRRRRMLTMLNGLAAVLVVGAIIGASVLLFTHRPSSTGIGSTPAVPPDPTPPTGTSVVASSTVDDLTLSLAMTPGPYFLSEMLALNISLTNHSQHTYYLGYPFAGSCGYATGVSISPIANQLDFTIPIAMDHSCPFFVRTVTLKPDQTISYNSYQALQSKGGITLTADVQFYSGASNTQNPFPYPTQIPGAFDKHLPSVHIDISPTIPANRTFTFTKRAVGTFVIVNIPPGVRSHVQYLYGVYCVDYNNDRGSTESGNYGWESITGNRVDSPGCPGKNKVWNFAFGIPGYAVAVGSIPPAP